MPDQDARVEEVRELRKVRQNREYTPELVSDEDLNELLEVARWTGSSQNTQPWHFIVVRDKASLKAIGDCRPNIAWVADSPLAIALVLNGTNPPSEYYDEGRITERLLIAARYLGLGAGTAWLGEEPQQTTIKQVLGIPQEHILRSVVVIGHPQPGATHKLGRTTSGRKPLDEVVSFETFDEHGN
ncbi:MAG TPA: nitroreductase family protein [Thermomicrobiales bacterium]|nr:nitroreductase family protein [Thermomicrobiales bacterium]